LPVSCHFRGCKVPLFMIVSVAISSQLALPFAFTFYTNCFCSTNLFSMHGHRGLVRSALTSSYRKNL